MTQAPDNVRILAVSGFSGSGKTTVIEQLVQLLQKRHLRVAAIKHLGHTDQLDRPDSDTQRLFHAGADVIGYDGQSLLLRRRLPPDATPQQLVSLLGPAYDVVLLEGFKRSNLDKLWLLRQGETQPPHDIEHIIATLEWTPKPADRTEIIRTLLDNWLARP